MIHKYRFKDNNIVLDVNSGSIHIVSDLVYNLLDAVKEDHSALEKKYGDEEVREAKSEIKALIDSGLLFSDDSHISRDMLENRGAVIKAICLHTAHDCNMSCLYCFAGKGTFWGNKVYLKEETGRKAIDFLLEHSGSRRNLEIDFFGGEPLLNYHIIEYLVNYGRLREREIGKNIRFTLTTNGLLLDETKEAFINEHMENVILSLDGRPEIQDAARKTLNGKGTYHTISNNYLRFQKKRTGAYYVRGTFTKQNLDFSNDVQHLAEMGFPGISIEPVVAMAGQDYALDEDDIPRILEEYDKIADYCLERSANGENFVFFHFDIDLEQGPCIVKRLAGCGAGTEYVAISPEGDIFPCHQFVGEAAFKLGNVHENTFNNKLYDTFNSLHVMNNKECADCWAKFYCSGGCHANAWHINGDMHKPYALGCVLERKRIECAIGIQSYLSP